MRNGQTEFKMLGCESYMLLPFYDVRIADLYLSEFRSLNIKDVYICGEERCVSDTAAYISKTAGDITVFSSRDTDLASFLDTDDTVCISDSAFIRNVDIMSCFCEYIRKKVACIGFYFDAGGAGEKTGPVFAFASSKYFNSLLSGGEKDLLSKLKTNCDNREIIKKGCIYDIRTLKGYKELCFDTLDEKYPYTVKTGSDGIFSVGKVPKGDYVAIPPVFFGKDTQIENGCVIGPYAVIYDNTLISRGTKVNRSIIMNDVYVSSRCDLTDSYIGPFASVRRGSLLLEKSSVGRDTIIGENCVIDNAVIVGAGNVIDPGSFVKFPVLKNEKLYSSIDSDGDVFKNGFLITPEKAARFGAALGAVFGECKAGVCDDGEFNSRAVKCGILGGLIASGVKTFDFNEGFESQLYYYTSFCDLDFGLFVSGGENGIRIRSCLKNGSPFGHDIQNLITDYFIGKRETVQYEGKYYRTENISSMTNMYINELCSVFESENKSKSISLFCADNKTRSVIKKACARLGIGCGGGDIGFELSSDGMNISAIEKGVSYDRDRLVAITAYDELKKGNDIAFFEDMPNVLISISEKSSGNIIYKDDEVDHKKNIILKNQLWCRDAVILLFKILSVLAESQKTLREISAELPDFYIARKVIEQKSPLSGDVCGKIGEKAGNRIIFDNLCKRMTIIAQGATAETAREICSETEKTIISILLDNRGK